MLDKIYKLVLIYWCGDFGKAKALKKPTKAFIRGGMLFYKFLYMNSFKGCAFFAQ